MAPKSVTSVPLILWFGEDLIKSQNLDMNLLKLKTNKPITHDYVFHTLLGIFDIKTNIYKKEKDLQFLGIKR